ncbi:MAG: hypothetical protein A2280_01275 [Candidatus Staskawiczbacteria bacterium RIFOXYA12_FULL_37_10]|nr:MAG: hypothetical protein A2280_01275 [Candidatus Staskawiczbacteria bacterium RIFOXYA12_FULL_37_10]
MNKEKEMSISIIKVVALDVYGTILAFDDVDDSFPPRRGIEDFFDNCEERGIKVVTSSDGGTGNVKNDLSISFKVAIERIADPEERRKMKERLSLKRFDDFFQLDQGTKDFSEIIGHYDIIPSQLLVIGDNLNKDIYGAFRVGARAILCPIYGIDQGGDWDFGMIDLDNIENAQ